MKRQSTSRQAQHTIITRKKAMLLLSPVEKGSGKVEQPGERGPVSFISVPPQFVVVFAFAFLLPFYNIYYDGGIIFVVVVVVSQSVGTGVRVYASIII